MQINLFASDQQEVDEIAQLMQQFESLEAPVAAEKGDLLEDFVLTATQVWLQRSP